MTAGSSDRMERTFGSSLTTVCSRDVDWHSRVKREGGTGGFGFPPCGQRTKKPEPRDEQCAVLINYCLDYDFNVF